MQTEECDVCGMEFEDIDLQMVDGQLMCEDCAEQWDYEGEPPAPIKS